VIDSIFNTFEMNSHYTDNYDIESNVINYAQICKNKNLSTINAIINGIENNNSIDKIANSNCVSCKTVNTIYHTYNMIGGANMSEIANNMCMNSHVHEFCGGANPFKLSKTSKSVSSKSVPSKSVPSKSVPSKPVPYKPLSSTNQANQTVPLKPKKTIDDHLATFNNNADKLTTTATNVANTSKAIGASVAGLLGALTIPKVISQPVKVQSVDVPVAVPVEVSTPPTVASVLVNAVSEEMRLAKEEITKLQAEVNVYSETVKKMKDDAESKVKEYDDMIKKHDTECAKNLEDKIQEIKTHYEELLKK